MADFDRYMSAKGRTAVTRRTSSDSADMIAPARARLRRIALRALGELIEATPLELVAHSGQTREALLPRLSEMIALGLAEPTGTRRRNPSGRSAAVLRLTSAGKAELATT